MRKQKRHTKPFCDSFTPLSESGRESHILSGLLCLFVCLAGLVACGPLTNTEIDNSPIDRFALVSRHNPVITDADPLSPLTVGNGEFAFTADITGLQSYPDFYSREPAETSPGPDSFITESTLEGSIPLVTQSTWGWHTFPNPENYTMDDATTFYESHGRQVPYASGQNSPAGSWLRQNPHRLNLARIGFELHHSDGRIVTLDEIGNSRQELDLWSGTLDSHFQIDGQNIRVLTWVHPAQDQLSVQIEAQELETDQLSIRIAFPYAQGIHSGDPSDWSKPDRHQTVILDESPAYTVWQRDLDDDTYYVRLDSDQMDSVEQTEAHHYRFSFTDLSRPVSFSVAFTDSLAQAGQEWPGVEESEAANRNFWADFWSTGGAIDLSQSSDPRAAELERRIVLSQYLTALQTSGSLPPQETGLTYNSWFGKFHLEMHWWHGVHYALWNRLPMLEKSLGWYESILPMAQETARQQDYNGARWPKMVNPDGRDSPSTVGVFLIWQQPHPIYFSELVYRNNPSDDTLEKYRDVVFETAEFMASYPAWSESDSSYVLGPPLIPAQEIHPAVTTTNPGFELAYWKYGLETAQAWRERLGIRRDPQWDQVLEHLPPLPELNGLYVNTESAPTTFSDANERRDHPTLLGSCGLLPCTDVDMEQMRRTLTEVMESWNWEETWGWDYPLVAMTAARVGEPGLAIEALLMDVQKNSYLPNGHNYQDSRLTIYLPGNGGLLTAAAMMAAGWDGGPDRSAPGFPANGDWVVKWENLRQMP